MSHPLSKINDTLHSYHISGSGFGFDSLTEWRGDEKNFTGDDITAALVDRIKSCDPLAQWCIDEKSGTKDDVTATLVGCIRMHPEYMKLHWHHRELIKCSLHHCTEMYFHMMYNKQGDAIPSSSWPAFFFEEELDHVTAVRSANN